MLGWVRWGTRGGLLTITARPGAFGGPIKGNGLFTAEVAVDRPCLEYTGLSHLLIAGSHCSCHRDRFVDQEIGNG